MSMNTLIIENVVEQLQKDGIDAEKIRITKNNIPCIGIRIFREDGLSPIIYYAAGESTDEYRARIDAALKMQQPTFNFDCLQDVSYIRNNLFVCIQQKSDEDILKQYCLNLEVYLRLRIGIGDETGSIKLSRSLINFAGVTEDEVWHWGKNNSRDCFRIQTMAETIGVSEDIIGESPFYVISSPGTMCGASSLFFPEVLHRYCEDHGQTCCYILPSSTEEVLVLNTCMDVDVESLAEMVYSVNEASVDPLLRLEPYVYQYDKNTGEIHVAAVYQHAKA